MERKKAGSGFKMKSPLKSYKDKAKSKYKEKNMVLLPSTGFHSGGRERVELKPGYTADGKYNPQ